MSFTSRLILYFPLQLFSSHHKKGMLWSVTKAIPSPTRNVIEDPTSKRDGFALPISAKDVKLLSIPLMTLLFQSKMNIATNDPSLLSFQSQVVWSRCMESNYYPYFFQFFLIHLIPVREYVLGTVSALDMYLCYIFCYFCITLRCKTWRQCHVYKKWII